MKVSSTGHTLDPTSYEVIMFYDVNHRDYNNHICSYGRSTCDVPSVFYCDNESQLDKRQLNRLNNRCKHSSNHLGDIFNVYNTAGFFITISGIVGAIMCLLYIFLENTSPSENMHPSVAVICLIISCVTLLPFGYSLVQPRVHSRYVERFRKKISETPVPGINTETDIRFKLLRKVDSDGTLEKVEQIARNSVEHPTWVLMQACLSLYLSDNELLANEIESAKAFLKSSTAAPSDELRAEYKRSKKTLKSKARVCIEELSSYVKLIELEESELQAAKSSSHFDNLQLTRTISQTSY